MTASRKALIVVAAFFLLALGLPWGDNVPAAFAQIQVTSANPDTGDQGTLGLNVTIGGKGFKKGAKANFYLKGTTNPAGVTVRATKFVSDTSLVATIDIAAGATPDDFDIVVANADGRTGKGTELFSVTTRASDELSAHFQDAADDMFRSDGLGDYLWPPSFNGGQVIFSHQTGNIDFQSASSGGRSATFQFGPVNNVRNAVIDGTVACRQIGDGAPIPTREPAPAWLAGGLPLVPYFMVRTQDLVIYTVVDGVGVWASTASWYSVRDIAVGSTAIVSDLVSFRDDTGRQYSLYFNGGYWFGRNPPYVSGFVKVTRENESTWVLQPLGAGDPLPLGVVNQAQLSMMVPEVRKVHAMGNCDLGDWLMPFKITFTSVR